jgi:hypothetical protein
MLLGGRGRGDERFVALFESRSSQFQLAPQVAAYSNGTQDDHKQALTN